jgi:hydrogenase/urease accessory protein HupE
MLELIIKITGTAVKWIILPAFIFLRGQAIAHPMPKSIVRLSVFDHSITGIANIPFSDLESALGGPPIENINSQPIREYFVKHINADSRNGHWTTIVSGVEVLMGTDPMIGGYKEVMVAFELVPPSVEELRRFTLTYDVIVHQVVTHSIVVFVENDWQNGIHQESSSQCLGIIELDVPTNKINSLEVNLQEGNWFKATTAIFILGMKHILTGLDHVLFLLTLLLIAPLAIVNNQWSAYQGRKYTVTRFLKISLAFTIGHSITLLAGGFNLIDFRVQYIEVLIALSILISALNCLRPVFLNRETLIAGGFGLIHGLAFSLTLSSMKLDLGSKLLTILGFNLGIEAMQLIIMVVFFPVILMSKTKVYPAVRMVFGSLTIVLSAAWIFECVTGQANLITTFAEKLI